MWKQALLILNLKYDLMMSPISVPANWESESKKDGSTRKKLLPVIIIIETHVHIHDDEYDELIKGRKTGRRTKGCHPSISAKFETLFYYKKKKIHSPYLSSWILLSFEDLKQTSLSLRWRPSNLLIHGTLEVEVRPRTFRRWSFLTRKFLERCV